MNQIPELTDESRAVLERAAREPEVVWEIQSQAVPDLMKKVDAMLIGGASPEWIMQRGGFFEMPVEIQTVFLNVLHWRQAYLRR